MPCAPEDRLHNKVRKAALRREMRKKLVTSESMNADTETKDPENEHSDDGIGNVSKRRWNGRTEFVLVKKWTTGETASQQQEYIDRELFELARDFMSSSGLKKVHGHVGKETDLALWKLHREYWRGGKRHHIRVFHCPMAYRCKCVAKIEGVRWSDSWPRVLTLETSGTHDQGIRTVRHVVSSAGKVLS
jgi:hypothetical protein